jgi:DNA-directed RNA polymerase subunit K/omega
MATTPSLKDYATNPVAVRIAASDNGSIYEAITAMGMRARQINDDMKVQLQARMQHIDPLEDESEYGNYDQLQISKEFDRLPKPTFIAMREMHENDLEYTIERPVGHDPVERPVPI